MTEDAATAAERAGDRGAGDVFDRSQPRLQDLLGATTSVVERLELEVVLRRLVEAGMSLVRARYGAMGVINAEGGMERFIHLGIDAPTVERIGPHPSGRGVLGAVIADREPIRLAHLAEDPRSVGFPEHHPAMESFLGVPVRVGEQVYGNLYLAESENGAFSQDDEELIVALAATAGIAIENARLYDDARTREVWNATIAHVMASMLDVSGENVLDVIAERVAALIDADLVSVAVPHGDGELALTTVHGSGADAQRDRVYAAAGTLSARALASRRAMSIEGQSGSTMLDWRPADVGPTMAIPLFAGDEPLGVLSISRPKGGAAFTDADVEMAFVFAAQASIALEVVRAREDRQRLQTAQDRARIARDLHDHVIQRLFAAGLSLRAISATADAETSSDIEAQIDAINGSIQDIRTVIFALSSGERPGAKRVRDRLLDVVTEVAGTWSAQPLISFAGPLDSLVSTELTDDLVAVLRELLINVFKHAHAQSVEIEVAIADDKVTLVVEDDGQGIPDSAPRSGLANVAERASLRGGYCRIASRAEGGTRIEWSAPAAYAHGDGS
jgi:signal transduction histidine kinase